MRLAFKTDSRIFAVIKKNFVMVHVSQFRHLFFDRSRRKLWVGYIASDGHVWRYVFAFADFIETMSKCRCKKINLEQ